MLRYNCYSGERQSVISDGNKKNPIIFSKRVPLGPDCITKNGTKGIFLLIKLTNNYREYKLPLGTF